MTTPSRLTSSGSAPSATDGLTGKIESYIKTNLLDNLARGRCCEDCGAATAEGEPFVHDRPFGQPCAVELLAAALDALRASAPSVESLATVVLRPSQISGLGCFTVTPLANDETVNLGLDDDWLFIEGNANDLPAHLWHYVVVLEGGYYRPRDFRCMSVGWYLNHSDTPNIALTDDEDRWFAKRDIAANEELTVDYRTLGDGDGENYSPEFSQSRASALPETPAIKRLTELHRAIGNVRSVLDRVQVTRTPEHDQQDRMLGDWQEQVILALGELTERAALDPSPSAPAVCGRCEGRGWIMCSETHDLGHGLGAGAAWNEPCPVCKSSPSAPMSGPPR